jgi:sugar lactone lactonase YvrE
MGQIAADSGGNVYVTETEYVSGEFGEYKINKVRKIAPNGDGSTLIYSEISDFENGDASLGGIAVAASGNVYVTELVVNYDDELGEYTSGKILKILPSGEASTFLDFGPGADEITGLIEGIAVDASENIYVLENLLESNISEDPWERPFKNIRQITPSGTTKIVAKERMNNSDGVMYNYPKNFISVDADGNVYYTSDNRIRKVTPSGIIINMAGRWMYGEGGFLDGPGSDALFSSPSGIIVDANGNVYVADAGNNRIRKITVLK